MNAASATASAPTTALPNGAEFSDWLSPILVKELRQGLKSRVFSGSFIVMQIVMILTMGLRLLEQSERGTAGGSFEALFWAMLWLPLFLLMPARGLGAVSEEARANTFDLVQLTRMTAFRITFGKWIALVAQTLLLVVALLPYAVLRYYFGGVDVLRDLVIIAHMLMVSMVLTAGAVALSAAPLAVRILVLVAALPVMTMGMSGLAMFGIFGGIMGGLMIGPSMNGPGWWLLPCVTALYVFVLLEFAAAKFAPLSENHPARKRAVALLLSIALLPAARFGGWEWLLPLFVFLAPVVGWVLLEALAERTIPLPAIYAPFVRRGFPARIIGRLLYPGWATAIPFVALVLGIAALAAETPFHPRGVSGGVPDPVPLDPHLLWPAFFFALISPLPVMLFSPRVRQRFWLYVLIQLVFTLLFAAATIAADSPVGRDPDAFRWLAPFPTASLMAILSHPNDTSVVVFLANVSIGSGLVMLAFMTFFLAREFRLITRLERASLGPSTKREVEMPLAAIHQRMKAAASVARLPLRSSRWIGVTGNVLGHGSGSSIDFQDQRPYIPGDDPRHINWQAYARTGSYTMKLYRQEVTPRVDLVFDASGSMFLDEAKTARSWELLYFCLESALRLGASLKLHTLRVIAEETPLDRALAYDWPENDAPGKPDFCALLQRVPLRAGSLRVVISDLLSVSPPEQAAAILSTSRGRAVVLAPFSRGEARPDWDGNIEFEDAESLTREKRRVEQETLDRYLRAYEIHFSLWREQCARRGIAFARIPCDREFIPALRAEAAGAGAVEM